MTHTHRRDVLKTIGSAGALLAAGTTTVAANPGPRQCASAESTITDIAVASDDFNVLVAALQETGLDAVLDSEDDQYTVFAPTDAAFEALADDFGVAVGDLLELSNLATILQYHVTEGRQYAPSIVNPAPVEMLAGGTVETDGTTLNGGQATLQVTDIEASNGVIHVIDGVLLP